ncbi:hypothetical protein HFO55_03205 [Rhizobium leguminosarum]|uniref:hypothetical protein n=1 Tax=Rhizobium leguminosarum TaxID=384 RepID=UPI001C94B22F|nr:hypothetical protein [Rhizobium leguminosarum]MBY5566269.1 hypothetical protein [Rhizobium leguminosarum]MBY5573547.1 hypothetical protein [Rhizobium leguminosarum]
MFRIVGHASPICYQEQMQHSAQTVLTKGGIQTALPQLRLTVHLLWRFWPQLAALWLLGFIGNLLLNEFAAMIGRWNPLAGLSVLALVVLLKLVVIVALFETVRRGLPALNAASRMLDERPHAEVETVSGNFVSALALTLVPFFAFYAAWGFLGDTVRDYSRLSLSLFLSGEGAGLLDVPGSAWLTVPVVLAWAVRRFAKVMHKRARAAIWPVLIVVCEANWAFIGVFVLSEWQDDIRAWFSRLPETTGLLLSLLAPVTEAAAQQAVPLPPELSPPPIATRLVGLFFYSLYPVVWLTLAALVYGYDIHGERPLDKGRLARAVSRWQALPKSMRDFVSHFIAGTLKRYRALAEGIGLALNSGIVPIFAAILAYRLLDWGSAWAWYGLTQFIGPHDLPLWQIIAQAISPFIGTPSEPGEGLLVTPIKICLLAATLEIGFAQGREWRGRK